MDSRRTANEVLENMSTTFVFARFDDREVMDQILDAVESKPSVSRWEATEGHYQLALTVEGKGGKSTTALTSIGQPSESIVCPIKKSDPPVFDRDPDIKYSYLLVEASTDQIERLWGILGHEENVIQVNRAEGNYNLIAVATAKMFDDIDQLVDDKISSLDGVLRVRQLRILKSWMR